MEHLGNEMLNPFTHDGLVIKSKKATLKKGTKNRGAERVNCVSHQAAGHRLCASNRRHFSNQLPFLLWEPSPADTSWAPTQHTRACHMFSGAPSLRLSLMKYSSPSADGKAVMSEIPVSVSCFCAATVTQQLSEVKRAGGFRWLTAGVKFKHLSCELWNKSVSHC